MQTEVSTSFETPKSKFLKDDLRYVLFSQMGLSAATPLGKKKAHEILEIAISHYVKHGVLATSLNEIAKKAKVPRSTLAHYFGTLEQLHLSAFKYIRFLYQAYAVEVIGNETHPERVFERYFSAAMNWPSLFPHYAQAWLAFLHMAQRHSEFRKLNSEAVQIGYERLAALVRAGDLLGIFKVQDARETAKALHLLITGLILSEATEDHSSETPFIRTQVYRSCRHLLGLE